MATIGTTSRPAYVYDQETDTWVPVGVGPHTHENFVTATTIDAKGDLLAGLSPDTVGRLPIGANGTLLVADSTQTLGMAWRSILTLTASTISTVPLTLKGATGQTANLFEIRNSTDNILASHNGLTLNLKTTTFPAFTLTRYGTTDASAGVDFIKSNSGTIDVDTAVVLNSKLFDMRSIGYDGSTYGIVATSIAGFVDGVVSTSVVPGRLVFSTTGAGVGNIERLRIDSTGRIQIPAGGVLEAPLLQNPQTGTTFGPAISDAGKLVELSNTSAITVTMPLNSSVPFPVGTQINLLQTNTGQVSVVGAGGVTLNATPGAKLRTQWSFATLIKRATDTWVLVGDITA
jgi:hypothetical protein